MSAEKGYLYALVNAAIPNLVKIGVTTKHPLERTKELSSSSGMPNPYVLAHYRHVAYPFVAESVIHRTLDQYRTNDSREFFMIPLARAIQMIDAYEAVSEYDLPFSELFATFPDDGSPRVLTAAEQIKCQELQNQLRPGYNRR